MTIQNAMIHDVIDGVDGEDRELVVRISLEGQSDDNYNYSFILNNLSDARRLKFLMWYTDSHRFKDLEGKIVRIATNSENSLVGIGHPIRDKFIVLISDRCESDASGLALSESCQ